MTEAFVPDAEIATAGQPRDAFGRPLGSLRISVTDRCNLRCRYCMPEEEYVWLERQEILTFEEIARLAGVFIGLGVDRLRLTGGEPLLRRDLPSLIRLLKEAGGHESVDRSPGLPEADPHGSPPKSRLRDLALTTNGVLLADQAKPLRDAGLGRITVSLDTLRPERFRQFARRDALAKVIEGVRAAHNAGFTGLKINTVVMRGFNDDELADLVGFGRETGAEVRFIEYMDVGGATHWSMNQVVSRLEILDLLEGRFGSIEPQRLNGNSAAPADRFRLRDGTTFGIISSTTQPFCANCDRARLTPDGLFLLCLYAREGADLKAALRRGATSAELAALIAGAWQARRDRGAEERKAVRDRGPLVPVEVLRRDPHLEMHTRGG
jgi:GTP 3',8-cyclase